MALSTRSFSGPRIVRESPRLPGHSARWTNFIDGDSERFEEELSARGIGLPLPQRHAWLRHFKREFRILQMRDKGGAAVMQAVVYIARPRVGLVAMGRARMLGTAASADDEQQGLALIRQLLRAEGDVVSLRLQPRRESLPELRNFEARARRVGFQLCDPEGVTRTLLLDRLPARASS